MRVCEGMADILTDSGGVFVGRNRPHGRVTVEPDWQLNATGANYGTGTRGPYRWFQNAANDQTEVEVPNIKSINIDRSTESEVASCTIVIYNQWMNDDAGPVESSSKLGRPGYFWPEHGQNSVAVSRWAELSNSWEGILVENALVRTYQGYGGFDTAGLPRAISDCVDDGFLAMTGVWLVDSIQGGTSGEMVLRCRDVGRLLLEQPLFPPLVPSGLYPLEYFKAGTSPFTTQFAPQTTTSERLYGVGAVHLDYVDSSGDSPSGSDTPVLGHYPSDAVDGNEAHYALSVGYANAAGTPWWEFEPRSASSLNQVKISTWRGPYTAYICIKSGGSWQGSTNVPGTSVPYVVSDIAQSELVTAFTLPQTYNVESIRIYLTTLFQSPWGDSGNYFRAGIREVRAGYTTNPLGLPGEGESLFPHAFALATHPDGGYYIADSSGEVYGFGNAEVETEHSSSTGRTITSGEVVAIGVRPQGDGYWTMNRNGQVRAFGAAQWYGDTISGSAIAGTLSLFRLTLGIQIVPTYTGLGYWIFLRDGSVFNMGDAPSFNANPNAHLISKTIQVANREAIGALPENTGTVTAAVGHPSLYGYWAVNESGELPPLGVNGVPSGFGVGVVNRTVTNSTGGPMMNLEYCTGIEYSVDGGGTPDGLWILSGSGWVWSFGAADNIGADVHIDPRDDNPNTDVFTFFQALTWELKRDLTGNGFYVLRADGTIQAVNATFHGGMDQISEEPYEGNFLDLSDIVKDLLLWAGWLLYEASPPAGPEVYGSIETTGILPENPIGTDFFDKKFVMDPITEIKQITGYITYVDEEGSFHFKSPNWWSSGNEVGGVRVSTIPVIDEELTLIDYTVSKDADALRSEIIISSSEPDLNNPSTSLYTRYVPETSLSLRGIIRPALWTNQYFTDAVSQQTMAELVALHIWFAQRTGSITCCADPQLSINDQVRIYERNTSETYIHYIRGISTQMDLETGEYIANITTNWLGTESEWAITSNAVSGGAQIRVFSDYSLDRLGE